MNRATPSISIITAFLLLLTLACHDTPATARRKENAARLAKLKAVPPASAPAPMFFKDPETVAGPAAPWQPLTSSEGELNLSNAMMDFSPRTARWRFTLTSESTPQTMAKSNQDHSHLKINLWVGDKDPQGNIIMHPVPTNFKRKGGAGCIQEFDNGLWPDGTPRPFQLEISGSYVIYHAKVEDLAAGAAQP